MGISGFNCEGVPTEVRKISFLYLSVFVVGAAVVGQSVVVEGFAHGVAPVSVFRTDGGGDGVGFCFRISVRCRQSPSGLQDAGSGVVARDEEHLVEGITGSLRFSTFLAQCVVFCFFAAVTCHAFRLPARISS